MSVKSYKSVMRCRNPSVIQYVRNRDHVTPRTQSALACLLLGCATVLSVQAGEREYFAAVQSEIHRWALVNRIDQGRLHRDKHSDCLLSTILSTTVNAFGELERVSVIQGSGVPVVDNYFVYATRQAALCTVTLGRS